MTREELIAIGARAIHERERAAMGFGLWCKGPKTCRTCRAFIPDATAVLDSVLPVIEAQIKSLPTTRTKAWDKGWDSVSLNEVLDILRGGPDGSTTP